MSLALARFISSRRRLAVRQQRIFNASNSNAQPTVPETSSYRVHDGSYSGRSQFKWTHRQEQHRQNFYSFKHQRKSYHCAICSTLLYEDEIFERVCETPLHKLPCQEYGRPPIVINNSMSVVVCKVHVKGSETAPYAHPGPLPKDIDRLNYLERAYLSPIKLISRVTRNSNVHASVGGGRYGHYQLSGGVTLQHSFDFAQMLYSGTLGLAYCREKRGKTRVNLEKVRKIFSTLKQINPLIASFELPSFSTDLMAYHLRTNEKRFPGWNFNMLLPLEDSPVTANNLELNDLVVGTNMLDNSKIHFGHPSLLALCFVHLYTSGSGHYSLWSREGTDPSIAEYEGGESVASKRGETLKGYTKRCLRSMDRRFSRDPVFPFVLLDMIERQNINARNTLIATTRGRTLRQRDVISNENGRVRSSEVTAVGSHIRSSYAYKKRNYYDLSAMFRYYGEPSLFFTMTCDDFSSHVKMACGSSEPWTDPELFASHFHRVWKEFFEHYILKVFARMIGGIREWSWVIETQQRVHCILWTTATTQELIDMNVVVAQVPSEDEDPDLRALVLRYQQHTCSSYCTPPPSSVCRFGYPFAPRERTELDGDRVKYKRNADECYINSYNPFFLRLLESNMDIQINNGRRALHYLAKYLTKHDVSTGVEFDSSDNRTQTVDFHFKHRVIGAVECVYDIMGYNRQRSSRGCVFVNLNLPDYDRRLLKHNIRTIHPDSTDIFARTHIEKYCNRDRRLSHLKIEQYFKFYRVLRTSEEVEVEFGGDMEMDLLEEEEEQQTGNEHYYSVRFVEEREFIGALPVFVKDTDNHLYKLRKRFPVVRHRSLSTVNGEAYFYQQIVLQYASFNYNVLYQQSSSSWQDLFFRLVREGKIRNIDNILEEELADNSEVLTDVMKERRLAEMLETASISQTSIFETILQNSYLCHHVVLGAAGSGKSYLLNMLSLKYSLLGYTVVKLAPTGVAALNIGGVTIHSFFGLHADDSDVWDPLILDTHFRRNRKTLLLIDEVSMISRRLAGVLNAALVETLQRFALFGGVETVFFGDMGQLPPVETAKSRGRGSFYESPLFQQATKFVLREPQRQSDPEFLNILNKVRLYELDNVVRDFIWSRMRRIRDIPTDAVRLYCTNELVERANWAGLQRLTYPLKPWEIESNDYTRGNVTTGTLTLKSTSLLEKLILRRDAPLLLLHNIDIPGGWTNGALLRLLDYDSTRGLQVRLLRNNAIRWIQPITRRVPISGFHRTQYPVKLAFATTIHKSQSMTLNKVAIEYSSMQTHGQLYVAMSRVRTADDIFFFGHGITQDRHIDLPVDLGAILATQELERQ